MHAIADALLDESLYAMIILALCTPEKAPAFVYLLFFGHGNAGYFKIFLTFR